MRPNDEKTPSGGAPLLRQERREQPKVGGAGRDDEPYESETGRKGATQNLEGTKQPGERKTR